MRKFIIRNRSGYTLIELLVALFIASAVLILLVSTLSFSSDVTAKITEKTSKNLEVKKATLYLQKQILKSKVIVLRNGRVYLEDMENKDCYNYYSLSAGILFRNKVLKTTLEAIPGGKSQLAGGFNVFELSLEAKNSLVLRYSCDKGEDNKSARFRFTGEVLY